MESGQMFYTSGMGRLKKTGKRMEVRIDDDLIDPIKLYQKPGEDRAQFINRGLRLLLMLHQTGAASEVRNYLIGNESELDFFSSAVRRAIENRKRTIQSEISDTVNLSNSTEIAKK